MRRLLILLILSIHPKSMAMDSRLLLFNIDECSGQIFREHLDAMTKEVEGQPFFPDFPYKLKVSLGLMRHANPVLLQNSKFGFHSIFPNYNLVHSFAYAGLKDGHVQIANQQFPDERKYRTDYAMRDFEYYRRSNLQGLAAQYAEWGLPDVIHRTIQLQEFMLAEHRKIELFISSKGRLLFFLRVQMGSHWKFIPNETMPYGGDVPYIETWRRDSQYGPFFYRKRIPTYFLPADLILEDPYNPATPVNRLRTKFQNYGIVELGRAFIPRDLDPAERERVKKMGFGMLLNMLPDFAPGRDLSKLAVVDTAPPVNHRLYKMDYEMEEFADLTPFIGGNILGPVYDILGRTFSDGSEVTDAAKAPEFALPGSPEPRPARKAREPQISLMVALGHEFANAIRRQALEVNIDHLHQNVFNLRDNSLRTVPPLGKDGWKFK